MKLSDVLAEIAPTFPGALEAVGRFGSEQSVDLAAITQESALQRALSTFIELVCSKAAVDLSEAEVDVVRQRAASFAGLSGSVTGQNEAFRSVLAVLREVGKVDLTPEETLSCEQDSRTSSGLALFVTPAVLSRPMGTHQEASPVDNQPTEMLLDTEVIAIYW